MIWVVDSADKIRLQSCKIELKNLLHQEKLAGATLLVLANKQDLEGSLALDNIVDILGLKDENFSKRHYCVTACSAVTGEGLAEAIDWIVNDIGNRIFMY